MTSSSSDTTPRDKDLLPNEQEVSYGKIQDWLQRNKALIIVACLVIIGGAAFLSFQNIANDKKNNEADQAFASAQTPEALEVVSRNYPETEAGLFAALLVADRYFQQGEWDRATQAYQRVLDHHSSSILAPSARVGLAAILQAKGQTDEAIKSYQSLILEFPHSLQAPQAQFSTGRLQEGQGKLKEARQTYETLITTYTTSAWKAEAQERIKKIDNLEKLKPSKPAS